jgi:hypothetical protein
MHDGTLPKPLVGPYTQLLSVWPALRGHFHAHAQVQEAEFLAFCAQHAPAVNAENWDAIRRGLVHHRLLFAVAPGVVTFEAYSAMPAFQPKLHVDWLRLWQELQTRLVLPLGCVWATQWLHPFLPQIPSCLIIEVNWAELRSATHIASTYHPLQEFGVLLRAWHRPSPVRKIQGVPTARLEKILVDVAQLPEVTAVVTDAELVAVANELRIRHQLDRSLLLQYAAQRGAQERWQFLLPD